MREIWKTTKQNTILKHDVTRKSIPHMGDGQKKKKTWHRTKGTESTVVNPVWDLHAHMDSHNLPISEIQRPAKEQSRQ